MSGSPRFTVISAVYNVSRYLPDFIASVESQDFDLSRVEVIMVDDGSTDESYQLLLDWAANRPDLVRVVTQPNAGQGAARNTGLARATGEWVTFPDPDDVLDAHYLSTVDAFITAHPDADLVATNRLIWNETTGERTNTHPLHRFFQHDRLVDLEHAETNFHGSAPAAFFRLARLRDQALEFDVRIRPNFEDGHFCSLYLLHCPQPLVGFLTSASYYYRKRADQSSSLQTSMLDPRRYTDVFTFGYLAILDSATELRGQIPRWLQHFLVYELIGYLAADAAGRMPVLSSGPELAAFHRNMERVLSHLDLGQVVPRMEASALGHHREALIHGYAEGDWHESQVFIDSYDPAQRLARARYYFTGTPPTEAVYNGEEETGARHAKTRSLSYFGRVLLQERVLWVRYAPDLQISLNGRWAPITFERQPAEVVRVSPLRVRRHTGRPSRWDQLKVAESTPTPTTPIAVKARAFADKPRIQKKFRNAWVVMDRIHDAGDSGEVLFRRLRGHHQEINAWFVIEEGTADFKRLRREFGSRVIAHGTLEWMALMAHCVNLLSSHADVPVMEPAAVLAFTKPRWRFTFLQHGVIKDDLSTWLSSKDISLFVTSTPGELASIAGDQTPYPFTTKEVKLTGLPRFDRLHEIGQQFGPAERDLVLVAPTWRRWLVGALADDGQRRTTGTALADSEFLRAWLEFVTSADLASICRDHGLTIGFLPHPNLQSALADLDLPDHVTALSYDGVDVQEYFARARILITDYSSIAFNLAYLNRPVVYFQFDADLVEAGGHVGRPGYFSYPDDGFGPVTTSAAAAIDQVRSQLAQGAEPAAEYRARIAEAFPERDGNCSERVIQAVLALRTKDVGVGQVPTPVGGRTR